MLQHAARSNLGRFCSPSRAGGGGGKRCHTSRGGGRGAFDGGEGGDGDAGGGEGADGGVAGVQRGAGSEGVIDKEDVPGRGEDVAGPPLPHAEGRGDVPGLLVDGEPGLGAGAAGADEDVCAAGGIQARGDGIGKDLRLIVSTGTAAGPVEGTCYNADSIPLRIGTVFSANPVRES